MELTVNVREIVAWVIALISLTLFLHTKIRNPTQQYYMAVQGLLVACYKKATFYSSQAQGLKDSKSNTTSLNEAQKIYEFVSNDYAVLTQHIFGVMKSIEPKELPFDVVDFLEPNVPVDEKSEVQFEAKPPAVSTISIGSLSNRASVQKQHTR
ncbi:MAG: hypothetical protein AAGA75_23130 [Cyanobacteria bacterium P01_E01_bin.6]